MGLSNATDLFETCIREILEGLSGVTNIADDVLIFGRTESEFKTNVISFLDRCVKQDMHLNPDKIQINYIEVPFFGNTLSKDGLSPDMNKVKLIQEWLTPTNQKELQSFLGTVNYLSRFLPFLSYLRAPLQNLLKKDNLHPISYASKRLSSTESNYSNIERELLRVLFAIMHLKHFICGCTVYVITDHKPLVSLFKKSLVDASPCLTHMLMQLLDYMLNIHYQPGERMHLSAALSCLSSDNMATGKTIKNLDLSIRAIEELTGFNSISVEKLHQHMASDPDLRLLIDHINYGFPNTSAKCPECIQPYFSFRDELSTCNGLVLKGNNRVVVPASLRPQG